MKNRFIFLPRNLSSAKLITQIFTKFLMIIGAISGLLVFFACEKKELPVKPYERGDAVISQVEMASDYKYQVWFSLDKNSVVSSNKKTDWDIAFEASANGFHIVLNGANAAKVYKTSFSELTQVIDTLGLGSNGKADMPSGNLDSTAFGDWQTSNSVFIVNRGYDENGASLGFYKIKIISQSVTGYTFEYGNVFGFETRQGSVTKNEEYNFIAYLFNSNSQRIIEPKKTEYDLCFTQYTYLFYQPSFQYYQVTGVLSNSYNTRVATINKAFSGITMNDTASVKFFTRRDMIGYDWKAFDFDNNLYTVNKDKIYLICNNKGFYYKLHFVDFYNNSGVKGFPKFEFKKL